MGVRSIKHLVNIISTAIFSGLNPAQAVLHHKDTPVLYCALIGCINHVRHIAHLNLCIHRPIYYRLIAEEADIIMMCCKNKNKRQKT